MPPTDASLLDYSASYGVPSLFMTAVCLCVLPLVYFRYARRRYARWPARVAVLLSVWMLAFGLAYGDVLWKAWHAQQLCDAEAGLTVYRSVRLPGIESRAELVDWTRQHLRVVHDFGPARLHRWPLDGPGDASSPRPAFVYHVVSMSTAFGVSKQVASVRRLETGEVLAVLTGFRANLGWMDRPLGALPGPPRPYCGGPGLPGSRAQPFTGDEVIRAAFGIPAEP